MKRVILLRHAKSSWSDPPLRDHARPLNKRGRRSADLIGRWLSEKGLRPDIAFVSSSERTLETWRLTGQQLGDPKTSVRREIYEATPETLLATLASAPQHADTVLLLGHQPGIGALAQFLLRAPPSDADFIKYPTAAVAVIDLPIETWTEIQWNSGDLVEFFVPRALE